LLLHDHAFIPFPAVPPPLIHSACLPPLPRIASLIPAPHLYPSSLSLTHTHGALAGQPAADTAVIAELEAAGYPRALTLRALAACEPCHLSAAYYLLVEAHAEATQAASRPPGAVAAAGAPAQAPAPPRSSAAGRPGSGGQQGVRPPRVTMQPAAATVGVA
jgi:hypothetical protein